jgi:hypothetical protein
MFRDFALRTIQCGRVRFHDQQAKIQIPNLGDWRQKVLKKPSWRLCSSHDKRQGLTDDEEVQHEKKVISRFVEQGQ